MKLSDTEIKKRLIRLRNVERLYEEQKVQLHIVRAENKQLKQMLLAYRKENDELKRTVRDLQLRIEELSVMVFGKKKQKEKDQDNTPKAPPSKRTPRSYRRQQPSESEVTDKIHHPINECSLCHSALTRKTSVTFFIEDIPAQQRKEVTRHTVEKGYCANCKKWQSSLPIPSAKVILGERVQTYVSYLSVIARLSLTQIRQLLYDTYTFSISDGEIVKILNRQAVHYRPAYEQLKESIRSEPIVHLDETGWTLLKDGSSSYAWSMSTPEGSSVFLIGESRGGGNVTTLLGEDYVGVVVTDDYGAYKKLQRHQLCWAHVLRKFRDLALSEEFDDTAKTHHSKEYQKLATIYQSVRDQRDPSLFETYARQLKDLTRTTVQDCKKLRTYKTTLLKNIPAYLTCLSDPKIPMTNNQAERSLRHLVLKRKVSLGSHSKDTANNLAILLSVFMSRRSQNPRGWFGQMLQGV